jgi:cell division protein ZapA (FtsZ GTPase activity inhibitor)
MVKGRGQRKYIDRLTSFIHEKAQEVQNRTRVVSTLDVVILTLLNVTDELFRRQKDYDEKLRALEQQPEHLFREIDRKP